MGQTFKSDTFERTSGILKWQWCHSWYHLHQHSGAKNLENGNEKWKSKVVRNCLKKLRISPLRPHGLPKGSQNINKMLYGLHRQYRLRWLRRDLPKSEQKCFSLNVADRASRTATSTTDGGRKALHLCSESLWEARGDVADLVWASEDNFSRLWIFTFHSHFRDFLAEISSRDNKLLAWTEKTFVDFELSNWIDFTGSEFWEHNLQKISFLQKKPGETKSEWFRFPKETTRMNETPIEWK